MIYKPNKCVHCGGLDEVLTVEGIALCLKCYADITAECDVCGDRFYLPYSVERAKVDGELVCLRCKDDNNIETQDRFLGCLVENVYTITDCLTASVKDEDDDDIIKGSYKCEGKGLIDEMEFSVETICKLYLEGKVTYNKKKKLKL